MYSNNRKIYINVSKMCDNILPNIIENDIFDILLNFIYH